MPLTPIALAAKKAAMPITVNGIGTHYYGKRDRSTRSAPCPFCSRVTALESYATRLWFVIFFIPVIPLGRKRIIDQCSSCKRHYAAHADRYEQAKQLQTSGALERFRREPSAESAVAAHAQLLAFHEHEKAAELRTAVLGQFPSNVGLRVQLAQQLRDAGAHTQAATLFREALQMNPEDRGARIGAAMADLAEGKPDEAHRLLKFLEEPGLGAQYGLGSLEILAQQYQRAGRHEEALELAGVLLREFPGIADHHVFRAFVRKSEKALPNHESILPTRRFSLLGLFRSKGSPYAPWQRGLAIAAAALFLLAVGLAINNEYIRHHRTLHVINACGATTLVQADDQPPVSIDGSGELRIAEGPHQIKVSGPVTKTYDVSLTTPYFERWFRTPVWILNPGGEAVIEAVTHVYSSSSKSPPSARPSRKLFVDDLIGLENCDYLFEKPPQRIAVQHSTDVVVKLEVNRFEGTDADAFAELAADNHDSAMRFAERRLQRSPAEDHLLTAYLSLATKADRPKVKALLVSGLERRPVLLSWHRIYQNLGEAEVPESELIARYDKYLEAEPGNAALWYLRGRLETDSYKARPYYTKAKTLDPKLAWPCLALAADAASQARWDDCLVLARKAKELGADQHTVETYLVTARLAKGDALGVLEEYRPRLASTPPNLDVLWDVIDAQILANKTSDVQSAVSTMVNRLPAEMRSQFSPLVQAHSLYQTGNIDQCNALCAQTPLLREAPIHADALVAKGNYQAIASDTHFTGVWEDPWRALALSIAFGLDGRTGDADKWRKHAIQKLEELTPHDKHAGAILASDTAPSTDVLTRLFLAPSQKALELVALGIRFPAKRAEYFSLAGKLNVRRSPPYQVVHKAISRLSTGQP
jgi:tetratricopeptide (TPR) repeat protein